MNRGEWGTLWVIQCLQATENPGFYPQDGERPLNAFGMDWPDLFVFVLYTKVGWLSGSLHREPGRSQPV